MSLLHGLQAQMQAQGIGDGPSKAWNGKWRFRAKPEAGREEKKVALA